MSAAAANLAVESISDSDLKQAIRQLSIALRLESAEEMRLDALKAELQRRREKRRGKEGA